MNSTHENGLSFKFAITGEQYESSPALLGRDNPYTLNVKVVGEDGKPVSGVRFKITSTNDGAHLVSLDGMDRTYTSSETGDDFHIEGLPAKTDADLKNMEYAFSVDCETEGETEEVTGHHSLRMGRLLRWGRPGISVKTSPDKAVFSTKTERVARESTPGAKWDWGEKINQCKIKLGTSIEGSGATSPTENNDGSFRAAPEIDLAKFSNVSKATLLFEGGLSNDQFTAVLPFAEENLDLYYFASVAFTKPSVIVGVPADVTCKLMGLDKKPRANVDVEWTTNFGTLDPAASKTDAQGVAKTACTANDAGTATVTVLSKAHHEIKGTSAAVPVGPLVIDNRAPNDARYIEGHTDPIRFSIDLKAGGQPVSGLTVEWFIGDTAKGTSTSNDSGKAVRDLTFTPGSNVNQVVKARVLGTQVQTTFDVSVYVVEMTVPEPPETEHVIGYSPDVTFSVLLKAGESPLVNAAVEWTQDGNLIRHSRTDDNGYTSHTASFDLLRDYQIKVKDTKAEKIQTFVMHVVKMEVELIASAAEYIIGYSPDVEYTATVTAGGKPLSNVLLEFTTADNVCFYSALSNSSGNVKVKKGFESEGGGMVRVMNPASMAFDKLAIPVMLLNVRAEWRYYNEEAEHNTTTPVKFRGLRYTLNIKLVAEYDEIKVGVPFKLLAPDGAAVGVEIKGLNEEKRSTEKGVDFEWTSINSAALEEITLMVASRSVRDWESVHPLGWLCRPTRATLTEAGEVSIEWGVFTDLPGDYRVPNKFSIAPIPVRAFSPPFWTGAKAAVTISTKVQGKFSISGLEVEKGQQIMIDGVGNADGTDYLYMNARVVTID